MDCRSGVLAGVDRLADAVQVTLGPKVGTHSRAGTGQHQHADAVWAVL